MSQCSCGCSPCSCSPVNCNISPCIIQLPDNPAQELTFENVNLAGIGFLNGVDGTNVEFRGLASESLALTVSLDAPNNTIILDFDDELLVADIPTASETERGIAEVATQSETNAGIVDNVIVTPAKLAARTATETRTGIAELATQAEVNAGINDATIITPLKLGTWWTAKLAGSIAITGDLTSATVTTGNVISDELTIGVGGAFAVSTAVSFYLPLTFESGSELQLSGAPIVDGFLVGRSGSVDELAIANVISTENTQTGWTITNPVTNRSLDVSAATLGDVREVLGTLIADLKAIKLPAS